LSAVVVTCSECLRASRVAHSQIEQLVAMAMYWEDIGHAVTPREAWDLCQAKDSYLIDARAFLGEVTQ
jgi:hypothetical protein